MSAMSNLASTTICRTGPIKPFNSFCANSSILSLVIIDRTSTSFMRHSMLIGASGFADNTFLVFSMADFKRKLARGFDLTSILNFSLNSSQKWWNIALSNAPPPKFVSYPVESTFKPFEVNSTTEHCMAECPISTNATRTGFSVNSCVLKMPYANAVAVVSCINRMTFNPQMLAASIIARLCTSSKKIGTDKTQSVILIPSLSNSAILFRSLKIIPNNCSGENSLCFPIYSTVTMILSVFLSPFTGYKNSLMSSWTVGSENFFPIKRFKHATVFVGCMLILSPAAHPTNRCLFYYYYY